MKSDEPVPDARAHVARSMLPWRSDLLTECGRRTLDVTNIINSEELEDRIARRGQQQAASTVCPKCWENRSPADWDTNPVRVIAREAVRAGLGDQEPSTGPEASQFINELHAIAALIDAHRNEFDSYVAALGRTVSITRQQRRRRGARPLR